MGTNALLRKKEKLGSMGRFLVKEEKFMWLLILAVVKSWIQTTWMKNYKSVSIVLERVFSAFSRG